MKLKTLSGYLEKSLPAPDLSIVRPDATSGIRQAGVPVRVSLNPVILSCRQ